MSNVTVHSAVILRAVQNRVRQSEIPAIKMRLNAEAESAVPIISDTLVAELNSHPVTAEFKGSVKNHSTFGLPSGNLPSFFGVSKDLFYDHLRAFRELLTKAKVVVRKVPNEARYAIRVDYPPVEEYYDKSPAPSDRGYDGSWLEKMEWGALQNFSHFLFTKAVAQYSRTGIAIQSQHEIAKNAGVTVPSIPYISGIYKNAFGGSKGWAVRLLSSIVGRFK